MPLQVRDEAAAWKAYGPAAVAILSRLESEGALEFATPAIGPEGALFSLLQRTRGEGESAAIAVAHYHGCAVATDDRQARQSCNELTPPVPTLSTEQLLAAAVEDGLLGISQAKTIWAATGISNPSRRIG